MAGDVGHEPTHHQCGAGEGSDKADSNKVHAFQAQSVPVLVQVKRRRSEHRGERQEKGKLRSRLALPTQQQGSLGRGSRATVGHPYAVRCRYPFLPRSPMPMTYNVRAHSSEGKLSEGLGARIPRMGTGNANAELSTKLAQWDILVLSELLPGPPFVLAQASVDGTGDKEDRLQER